VAFVRAQSLLCFQVVRDLAFLGCPSAPLGNCIARRLTDRRLHPRHERAIEFEIVAAFRSEKPPNFLGIRPASTRRKGWIAD
jgi:hypothetical protein